MSPARRTTRPPVKQDAIVRRLTGDIASGKLPPGERLPTRAEVERRFDASSVTVQRAFDRLIASGFVTSRGRGGTFVAERPPHLFRFVLALPSVAEGGGWVNFWTVLVECARELEERTPLSVSVYAGVSSVGAGNGYHALLEDVRERRVAGIVFATDPWTVAGTPIVDEPGIPRVAFGSLPSTGNVPVIRLGSDEWHERALDHLASRGRKRVALLTVPGLAARANERFMEAVRERGMECRPQWVQAAPQSEPVWARNAVLAVMSGRELPDGLVITDDNLVEHACSGLIEAGVKVPGDLEVVAHCNFPARAPSVLRISRLGYGIRAALATCIDTLSDIRRGKRAPKLTRVPPLFEWEVDGGDALPDVVKACDQQRSRGKGPARPTKGRGK
ncbi:MAG: substrate-binding domain-containing protein [Planctomycetota bacterium]|jgi:hypothetical protein